MKRLPLAALSAGLGLLTFASVVVAQTQPQPEPGFRGSTADPRAPQPVTTDPNIVPVPAAKMAPVGGFESILVDNQGRTLYTFSADQANAPSTCREACATAWPPASFARDPGLTFTPGEDVGVGDRGDGSGLQLTWRGLPLYRFAQDAGPGSASGNGIAAFGGTWSVVVWTPLPVTAPEVPTGEIMSTPFDPALGPQSLPVAPTVLEPQMAPDDQAAPDVEMAPEVEAVPDPETAEE